MSATTAIPVIAEHIAIRPGYCGGRPHIAGHRIRVQDVAIWHERGGMTPAEIVVAYPTITLADVHAALAYYHDHRQEIWDAIQADEKFADELRAQTPPSKLDQLRANRRAANDPLPPG